MTRLSVCAGVGALVLTLLLHPSATAAQQMAGTIYLTDGSVLTGTVVDYVPGDHVTLQIGSAAPIVIPQANIARAEIGQSPTATQVVPSQQPYYAPQQPYQLQPPADPRYGQPPARRRPSLGLPITFLAIGVPMAIAGGLLIAVSDDGYYYDTDPALLYPGIALAATGTVFAGLGITFLIIRIAQRRRWSREQQQGSQYGLAPIIAPQQGHYGLLGTLAF